MVKYYETSTTFQFNWNQVAQAYWRKYPNPNSNHVIAEDIISRTVKDGVLYTKRMLVKTGIIPKWGRAITTKNVIRVIEDSVVDPKTKTLTTYTRNMGENIVMNVTEKVVYKVSDENPEWTIAKRSAQIDSKIFGLGRAIQMYGLDRFKKYCTKASYGFNYVLAHMFPQTAQLMNPTLAQMGFTNLEKEKETASAKLHNSLHDKAEKVKDAAKKATDLAKQKAAPIYAACESNKS